MAKKIRMQDSDGYVYPITAGYVPGETVTVDDLYPQFPGVAASKTLIRFMIPMTKSVTETCNGVQISGACYIRYNGVQSDEISFSSNTVTLRRSHHGILVQMSFASSQSYLTSLCPIIVQPSSMVITFS